MIATLVVVLLGAAGALYVASALRPGPVLLAGHDVRAAALARRRDSALAAIVDLENERALGKLAPEDFEALALVYEREALGALRDLDRLAGARADPGDDPIEREVAAAKARLRCPSCGSARPSGASRTCPHCGA